MHFVTVLMRNNGILRAFDLSTQVRSDLSTVPKLSCVTHQTMYAKISIYEARIGVAE